MRKVSNYVEFGPGMTITPNVTYPIKIRLEHVYGKYLPAGKMVNPYPAYYPNNVVQLIVYTKF